MKRRQLLLPLPHLPTITETLEDLPVHPSSSQPTQTSQSLEDYMNSIQALAFPVEAPSCGPVRLQRSPRLRQFSKAQMKLSASSSLPRGAPRTLRTSRLSSLGVHSTEDASLSRGKDPVDWLFGQIRTWTALIVGLPVSTLMDYQRVRHVRRTSFHNNNTTFLESMIITEWTQISHMSC